MTTHPSVSFFNNLPEKFKDSYLNYADLSVKDMIKEFNNVAENNFDKFNIISYTLSKYIDLKFPLTMEQRGIFAKELLKYLDYCVNSEITDLIMCSHVCHTLVRLIKKQASNATAEEAYIKDLVIDWKIFIN